MAHTCGVKQSCEKILAEYFGSEGEEFSSYISGVLSEGSEEFQSTDDVYNAVGDFLIEIDSGSRTAKSGDSGEDVVRVICEKFLSVIKGSHTHVESHGLKPLTNGEAEQNGRGMRVLEAPVTMSNMSRESSCSDLEDKNNIWIAKRKAPTKLDEKKLEKAENKLKEKQDKRVTGDYKPKAVYVPELATASQQTNRKEVRLDESGNNRSYDIRLENFDVSFGERTLIQNADLQMIYGRRYGLVGRNGIGKTTLLRMLASGALRIATHITVLHVEQEVVGDNTTALDSVLECDIRRHALLQEEKQLVAQLQNTAVSSDQPITAATESSSINTPVSSVSRQKSIPAGADANISSRLTEIYAEMESIEADKAPAKAAVILSGLGFSPEAQRRPTKEFSGGWRMRLSLARALFSRPDLLLLDEPTNMLDMKAVIWLENYLQTWASTILVVSHDREFLNSIVTDVLHLHSQHIDAYRGDYENFVKTKTEKAKNQQREYEAQLQYREHIQIFIDRFRYNANRAAQVQSKLKILEKLPKLVPLEKESEVVFRFPDVEKLQPPILQLDEVTFHYDKTKPIFKNVNISASFESRICIVGENGAGKTTLLKVLLGDLSPVSGVRHAHRNLRIGYFNQHHVDQLDLNSCSVEILAAKFPGKNSEYYRGQLGGFGVTGELAMRPVATLSGGQKSRVAFALINMSNPNFLILDEPTNHLDMETIEALSHALAQFKGGVMLVSHDERLIRMVCNEVWICGNHTVRALEGGIDEYKRVVKEELATQVL